MQDIKRPEYHWDKDRQKFVHTETGLAIDTGLVSRESVFVFESRCSKFTYFMIAAGFVLGVELIIILMEWLR